jgi:ABC-type lipoprotein release transport system permease subunit
MSNEFVLYFRLAWRNVWRHRRRTIIIVSAMSLALSMMMLYDGLIDGFNQAIYGNAIKVLGGNIQVRAEGYRAKANQTPLLPLADDQAVVKAALANSQVVAATRRITTGGLTTSAEGAFAISIIGIEPDKEQSVNLAAEHIIAGRFLAPDDVDSVLFGKGLADAMGVQLGDRIAMTGRTAHEQMRNRTMTIIGIYDLGMADIEKRSVYISLSEAQDLYELGTASTEVAIVLKQVGEEAAVIKAMKPGLPGYEIESFEDNYPELKAALGTKGAVMDIFGIIIIAIAGIGILNLLLMAVYERTREIGVLGALGLKPGQISLLFILEGTLIGVIGVLVGVALGLFFNGLLMRVGLDFSSYRSITSYMALISDRVYPSWGVGKLLQRALMVAIISALASILPAREAAQREPAEALHFV